MRPKSASQAVWRAVVLGGLDVAALCFAVLILGLPFWRTLMVLWVGKALGAFAVTWDHYAA